MKVSVDHDRCQGHARCIAFAPAVFAINDEGYASVREGREQVSLQFQECVRTACSNCPEHAILISDD
jgi:ferredoxin